VKRTLVTFHVLRFTFNVDRAGWNWYTLEMMCKLGAILALLAMAGCAGPAATPGTFPQTQGCPISSQSEEIAAQFRDLRAIKGHFQDGDWNPDVDAWMGRKHQLMLQLGARLGAGDCLREQLVQLLGPPDLTAREGDAPFDSISRLPEFDKPATGPCELLVYTWRGTHDFLYFTAQGETIFNSGWWQAGD
jgi:hypothetical protein